MIDEDMNKLKRNFLYNEIWLLAFGGAFQRAHVYKASVPEKERAAFRKALKAFIIEHILGQYKKRVAEKPHVLNMEGIRAFSENWGHMLSNGRLNIGVSQKLLNLVLKYYWCLGEIDMPPHCPLDRIIQQRGLKDYSPVNWTELNDMDEYLRIMHRLKLAAAEKGQSIAEWELEIFSRTNSK